MIIGVPKEIKGGEHRVALMPAIANQLVRQHQIVLPAVAQAHGLPVGRFEMAAAGAA